MKKYLMTGIAAVAMGAAMTSCSHDEIQPYSQSEITQAKYAAAFVQAFGQPSSTQTWGFGNTNKARTRAAEFGWEESEGFDAEFDKDFIDYVKTALPEEVSAGSKLNNYEFVSNGAFQFSFVYSQTSNEDKVGYYYYNPSTQTIANRTEVIIVNNIKNELPNYLRYGTPNSWDDNYQWKGVESFNADQYWGWGATVLQAKVFTVNVPAGYRVGFFLICKEGYTLYSNRELNNTDEATNEKFYYSAVADKTGDAFLVGFEDWYYPGNNSVYDPHVADCNDVVIAINQKTSTPPTVVEDPNDTPDPANYEGRVFAEDLSAEEISDFDFNDVVFDWELTATGANIRLLAAGGTLPLYIGGTRSDDLKSIIGGVEVHGKLGAGTGTMINTGVNNGYDEQEFSIEGSYANANEIPVWVLKNGQYELLEAKRGEPACKINVPVGTKWADEFVSISKAYTWFNNWVQNENTTTNWASPVARFVDLDLSNND